MQLSACQFYSDSIRKRREWKGGGSFAPLLVRLVASRLPSTRIISKRCEFIGHSRERREREREKRERDVAEEGRQSRKSTHQTANITCFGHEGSACEDPCKVPSKRSRTEGVIRNSARKCKLFTPRYGPRKRPISIGIRGLCWPMFPPSPSRRVAHCLFCNYTQAPFRPSPSIIQSLHKSSAKR